MYTNISFLHGLRKKRNIKSSFLLYIMLGKLPFVLGYGVYCQNGGSEKIFFQFLTSCKKCLDAGKLLFHLLLIPLCIFNFHFHGTAHQFPVIVLDVARHLTPTYSTPFFNFICTNILSSQGIEQICCLNSSCKF